MKKLLLVFLFLAPFVLQAQIISTFAGTGSSVYSGNGTPATSAGIPDPIGGFFDKYGDYYFVDGLGVNRARKIDTAGIIVTVAGTGMGGYAGDRGQATAAKLYLPQAIIQDTAGNLYIADAQNNCIRKVDAATGIITTIAGNNTPGFSGDGGPATAAMISDPNDICLDKRGNLYIADLSNQRVRKVDPSGIITTFAGLGILIGDGGPATNALLNVPQGITVDDTGNVYIADVSTNRVRKVDTFGIITTVAGNGSYIYAGDNILATAANINPGKVAIDHSGNLFIADWYNVRVFKVDNAGIIHLIAGNGVSAFAGDGGPATSASLYYPSGLAFDPCGNLYITEPNNRRIRKVTFNPSCTILSLSVNTIEDNTINIYPNPTINLLQIDNLPNTASYNLLTIVGATMQQGTLHRGSNTIDLGTLPTGMYLLQLIDEQGNRSVSKVMKE